MNDLDRARHLVDSIGPGRVRRIYDQLSRSSGDQATRVPGTEVEVGQVERLLGWLRQRLERVENPNESKAAELLDFLSGGQDLEGDVSAVDAGRLAALVGACRERAGRDAGSELGGSQQRLSVRRVIRKGHKTLGDEPSPDKVRRYREVLEKRAGRLREALQTVEAELAQLTALEATAHTAQPTQDTQTVEQ